MMIELALPLATLPWNTQGWRRSSERSLPSRNWIVFIAALSQPGPQRPAGERSVRHRAGAMPEGVARDLTLARVGTEHMVMATTALETIQARPATVRAYALAKEINPNFGQPAIRTEEERKLLFGQTAAVVR